jgi:hydrogenase maturation protease
VLVIGYGNPGRLDDGLGPALAERLARRRIPGVTVDADYQLTVEDAAAVAAHGAVVFADASVDGAEPFFFREVAPAGTGPSFSSHSVEPAEVLGMARALFGARTRGYALGIRGYAFDEFGERLSERAEANLAAALRFLARWLRTGRLEKGRAAPRGGPKAGARSKT